MPEYTWQYSNSDRQFTLVTQASGNGAYSIVSATGHVGQATITGLGTANNADNKVFNDGSHPNDAVDGHGFSLTLSDGTQYNLSEVEVGTQTHPGSGIIFQTHPFESFYDASGNQISSTQVDGYTVTTNAPLACYVSGTMIAVPGGDVAIEALEVGDTVITSSGRAATIKWLGHREIQCLRHADPDRVFPIEIAQDAISPGVPRRPLMVSPHHAVAIYQDGEEVIVPAMRLVNGSTIQTVYVERVHYWHIELDKHDLIVANGMAAETYQDIGNRAAFDNCGEVYVLHPEFINDSQADCRPRIVDGERLTSIREALEDRAVLLGWQKTAVDNKVYVRNDVGILPHSVGPDGIQFRLQKTESSIFVCSDTFEPRCAGFGAIDARPLGCYVSGIELIYPTGEIDRITMDDARLCNGFHDVETNHAGAFRWTDGAAELPRTLWSDIDDDVVCVVRLTAHAVQKWSRANCASQAGSAAA